MKDTKIQSVYDKLFARYGDLNWWPAKTPYEVIVGAILTQNTNWGNVEKAITNFGDRLSPEFVAAIEMAALIEIIRPAGFFYQKANYLKAATEWFGRYGYDIGRVKTFDLEVVRKELLSVKGIGQETADSILLYAFEFATFVVDAYTIRLCERLPINTGKGYSAVKAHFEANISKDVIVYNHYHALIVINAKEHCRKKPFCEGCPLSDICENKIELCRSTVTR